MFCVFNVLKLHQYYYFFFNKIFHIIHRGFSEQASRKYVEKLCRLFYQFLVNNAIFLCHAMFCDGGWVI